MDNIASAIGRYPATRLRRLRQNKLLREMLTDSTVRVQDLILPIFVQANIDAPLSIPAMPGVMRCPESQLAQRVKEIEQQGICALILFAVCETKDAVGSEACRDDGILARMIGIAKHAAPNMLIIADICFCEYTSHGHCGTVLNGDVDNEQTVAMLRKQSLVAARAGADMLAPSGMMDGMVAHMRAELDSASFHNLPIMSYSSKFASAFYGPFRDAVDSDFKGSRASYQLDPSAKRQALQESLLDVQEGADILMVKPGMPYLDVLASIREQTLQPLAVYQVSGEYAMLTIAGQAGVLDLDACVMESMTAFKRAGADLIITYFAERVAGILSKKTRMNS